MLYHPDEANTDHKEYNMSHSLQIWKITHNASVSKDGIPLSVINFWAQDGIQFFTFIATDLAVKAKFQDNDTFTVESLVKGTLTPAGTPWSKAADKSKKLPARSGFTPADRQQITFSGVKGRKSGEPPVSLSTL